MTTHIADAVSTAAGRTWRARISAATKMASAVSAASSNFTNRMAFQALVVERKAGNSRYAPNAVFGGWKSR